MKHGSLLLCPQHTIPVLNSDQRKTNPHPPIQVFKTAQVRNDFSDN